MTDDVLVLPHNLEAERAILGAVLLENARLAEALEQIRPEDFFRAAHRRIFSRMVIMGEAAQRIDTVTLKNDLAEQGWLEDVGGPAYLGSLTDGVPRSTNVVEYAAIVKRKAQLRLLIAGANTMLRQAYADQEDADDVLATAERTILGLAHGAVAQGFEPMRTIVERGMDVLERAYQRKEAVSGIPSGFQDLDQLTRGFQPGTLVTIGARPGMGKTSFALNIALHAALSGRTVGFCSLEMVKMELFIRQLAAQARIDSHRLNSGYLGEREWARLSVTLGQLSEAKLFIDETPAVSLFEVRPRARRLKTEHDLQLLVIDYLQLMSSHTTRENRTREIEIITSGLKSLAKELQIPILLLSQLSRDLEKRGDRPKLSDLRQSGSIEQDSDIVMFLYRADTAGQQSEESTTELIIAKHRGGPVGTVKLTFVDSQTRFESYAPSGAAVDQWLPAGDR